MNVSHLFDKNNSVMVTSVDIALYTKYHVVFTNYSTKLLGSNAKTSKLVGNNTVEK